MLLQPPGDSDVAPRVLLSHPQRQFFGDLSLRGSAGAFGRVVKGPFPSLHPSVPSEKCFRSDDRHDLGKALFDGESVAHQGSAAGVCQWHSFDQLAAQNLVLLLEEVVLPGKVFAERLLDNGNESSGSTSDVGRYAECFYEMTGKGSDSKAHAR